MQYLGDLHRFVYTNLPDDELLWATSMPCAIKGDESIPIAQFGSSNVGRMKTVYRNGLGHRYGRVMQAIAGVHFNYSFPDHFWPVLADVLQPRDTGQAFRSEAYFSLLRNYRRHGWIVLYLFGNSPALCPSFLQGRKVDGLRAARARQPVRAVRHLAAHERPRLPQQEPGGAQRLGQQPRALRARPDAPRSARRIPSTRRSA